MAEGNALNENENINFNNICFKCYLMLC